MTDRTEDIHVVIITGMSGAGKTVAIQSFEDLGYYCIDNLPPAIMPTFIDLIENSAAKVNKVALVIDLRGREFFDDLLSAVDQLQAKVNLSMHILFLDAKDQVLVQRYKETRRSHPLAQSDAPLEGILQERKMLEDLKGRARQIIDTSDLTPRQLREKILRDFADDTQGTFSLHILSFGFKYGMPIDADLVLDVRFLPNPHYIDHLQPKTGLEEEVSSYVLKWTETKEFLQKLLDLLTFLLPHYKREGKSQVVIAIGCTGGKHRSVTLTEYIADYYSDDYLVYKSHRDIAKGKKKES